MQSRQLGQSGLEISPIGFGAFKIGRNQGIKYPQAYDLPDEAAVARLLNAVLDMGINYIDTAPAYGLSEERIGRAIADRRDEYVLSTKIGETFLEGKSVYDFSRGAIRRSIDASLNRLQTDRLDLVFIHSDGDDLRILEESDAVATLCELKAAGIVRAVGMSGKTIEGARRSLEWADAVMVEYHLNDRSHAEVIAEAAGRGVGVVVKKGLSAGHLSAEEAIRFVLGNEQVAGLVIGGLNADHYRMNLTIAEEMVTRLREAP